jgi:secondary thiamine-phosphate synthase enzyme
VKATRAELTSLLVHRGSFTVTSESRRQAVDIRAQVEETVLTAGVRNGVLLANCLHTTCSVVITDSAGASIGSIVRLMRSVIDENQAYRHNDLRWSDCERGNAAAHLRAGLLGHGVTIGIADGALTLEAGQSILLAEWDGPRSRTVDVQVLGA